MTYKKLGPDHTPPAATIHTKDITVAKADGVTIVQGNNTPVGNGQAVLLVYRVESGGNACGPYLAGTAQERLTNRMVLGVAKPDADWAPAAAAPTFRLFQGQILDEHAEELPDTVWNSLAVGDVIRSATQELRIVWSDSWGNLYYDQTVGTVEVIHRKTSNIEWRVEASVQP